MSTLRIEVRIDPDTNPEIHRDLTQLPAKRRAERLRTLSTLGLVSLGSGYAAVPASAASPLPGQGRASTSSKPEAPLPDLSGLGFS